MSKKHLVTVVDNFMKYKNKTDLQVLYDMKVVYKIKDNIFSKVDSIPVIQHYKNATRLYDHINNDMVLIGVAIY